MAAVYKRKIMEKITKNVQLVLLIIILISTIIAVGIEIKTMFLNLKIRLFTGTFY